MHYITCRTEIIVVYIHVCSNTIMYATVGVHNAHGVDRYRYSQ